jgi:hypothetical protein
MSRDEKKKQELKKIKNKKNTNSSESPKSELISQTRANLLNLN